MTMAAQTATEVVKLSHHYAFPHERVFQAWTKAEALGQWFGPHSHDCKVEEYDFREGGNYQIRMIPVAEDHDCKGDPEADSVCAGKFVEIIPNEKIAMTFGWIENGADIGETLLTIEFKATDAGTDIVLTHERLPNEELRLAHEGGWQGTLECLEEYLS